jgi:hypothetical protein
MNNELKVRTAPFRYQINDEFAPSNQTVNQAF